MIIHKNWTEIIKPKALRIDPDTFTGSYGKFEAKPLDKGFGTTLGNSLRRVLLSSLQGAAVTNVRIEGVLHEFTTVKNVVEDVSDIIMNLKEVRFRLHEKEKVSLRINVSGEKTITAADIETVAGVEILNPDQHIATLYGGTFEAELLVKVGRGYCLADENKDADLPVDMLPIDSIFSPVRKVNWNVTNARVEQVTDYDKLVMEVWTDGSVKPDDAVAYAARILEDQLKIFINFEDEEEVFEDVVDEKAPSQNFDLLDRRVDEMELSVRSANCLQTAEIRFIGELVQKTENEMLKTKNFGRKSLNEIKELLSTMGLALGMKIDGWKQPEYKMDVSAAGTLSNDGSSDELAFDDDDSDDDDI